MPETSEYGTWVSCSWAAFHYANCKVFPTERKVELHVTEFSLLKLCSFILQPKEIEVETFQHSTKQGPTVQ